MKKFLNLFRLSTFIISQTSGRPPQFGSGHLAIAVPCYMTLPFRYRVFSLCQAMLGYRFPGRVILSAQGQAVLLYQVAHSTGGSIYECNSFPPTGVLIVFPNLKSKL